MVPLKVIAFDLFGTVFDLSNVPRGEIKEYANHVRKTEWSPLTLPHSWRYLPAFPDAKSGLEALRGKYTVVSMSNCPLDLQQHLCELNELVFDYLIDLSLVRAYKPHPSTYKSICTTCHVEPSEVLMVTANPNFGDVEGSLAVGMRCQVIRNQNTPKTIGEIPCDLFCG